MRAQLSAFVIFAALGFATAPGSALAPTYVDAEVVKQCCKVCREGKACGDSCIARDRDCHKPPGCACDG